VCCVLGVTWRNLLIPKKQTVAAVFSKFSLLCVTCVYLENLHVYYRTFSVQLYYMFKIYYQLGAQYFWCYQLLLRHVKATAPWRWLKHVGAIINNNKNKVQQVANKYGTCHTVQRKMYNNNVISSCNRSQQDALYLSFILISNSTCFGETYCPSSGILILYLQQLVFVILVMLTVASRQST